MATSTYYPNSASCSGFDGKDTSRPPASATALDDSALTSTELNNLSNDGTTVTSIGISRDGNYAGFSIIFTVAETIASITRIDVYAEGYGVADNGALPPVATYGYNLYVRNYNTSAWDSVASHANSSETQITGALTSNISNYFTGQTLKIACQAPISGIAPSQNISDRFWVVITYTLSLFKINIGDAWKDVAGVKINIGDVWKAVTGMKINIGDAWKTVF